MWCQPCRFSRFFLVTGWTRPVPRRISSWRCTRTRGRSSHGGGGRDASDTSGPPTRGGSRTTRARTACTLSIWNRWVRVGERRRGGCRGFVSVFFSSFFFLRFFLCIFIFLPLVFLFNYYFRLLYIPATYCMFQVFV